MRCRRCFRLGISRLSVKKKKKGKKNKVKTENKVCHTDNRSSPERCWSVDSLLSKSSRLFPCNFFPRLPAHATVCVFVCVCVILCGFEWRVGIVLLWY